MKKFYLLVSALILSAFVLSACGEAPPLPTATASAIPTTTPTPEPPILVDWVPGEPISDGAKISCASVTSLQYEEVGKRYNCADVRQQIEAQKAGPAECKLNEVIKLDLSAGPQKFSSDGWEDTRVVVFTPHNDVKQISFIVEPGQTVVWTGYVSVWTSDVSCTIPAWAANAKSRTEGVKDHSGIVVQFSSDGTLEINALGAALDLSQVERLIALHQQFMEVTPQQ